MPRKEWKESTRSPVIHYITILLFTLYHLRVSAQVTRYIRLDYLWEEEQPRLSHCQCDFPITTCERVEILFGDILCDCKLSSLDPLQLDPVESEVSICCKKFNSFLYDEMYFNSHGILEYINSSSINKFTTIGCNMTDPYRDLKRNEKEKFVHLKEFKKIDIKSPDNRMTAQMNVTDDYVKVWMKNILPTKRFEYIESELRVETEVFSVNEVVGKKVKAFTVFDERNGRENGKLKSYMYIDKKN